MSKESFRRDLRRTFDEITGAPSSNLGDKVRSRLDEPVEQRAPMWAAGLAAALIAVIVVGVLVVVHPFNRNNVGLVGGSPTPSASPSPLPSPSPSPAPPVYECTAQTHIAAGYTPPPNASITAVRVGNHPATQTQPYPYDQITIEFKDARHGDITIDVQPNSTFMEGGSGAPVKLAGKYGLKITLRNTDEHPDYSGPTDYKKDYPQLKEARLMEDSEGVVTWGVGLANPACYRVVMLDNPTRLVIYLQIQ